MSINFEPRHEYFSKPTKTLIPGLLDTCIKNAHSDGSFLVLEQACDGRREDAGENDLVVLDWETQKELYLVLKDRFGEF